MPQTIRTVPRLKALLVALTGLMLNAHSASADSARCRDWAAQLVSLEGAVSWRAATDSDWQAAGLNDHFCHGDSIRVDHERAALRLANNTLVRLNENSLVKLLPERESFWVELIKGAGHFLSRTPKDFTVKAPYLNAAVDGTEFVVTEAPHRNSVGVIEGGVIVSNDDGVLRLGPGESATAGADSPPLMAPRVRLREAAEWTLYFPPLVVHTVEGGEVQALIDQGRYSEAYRRLKDSGAAGALTAALALALGRAKEADAWLQSTGDTSPEAQAVQALATLFSGRAEDSLQQTHQLLAAHPDNLSVLVAHSYALQGTGELGRALTVLEHAHQLAPENLFLRMRLAGLYLSHGEAHRAEPLVERALASAGETSRVHTIAGFVALNRLLAEPALEHFSTAVELDSGDPLAHFGKGLALWQGGDSRSARQSLELAVLLDPHNSTLRSYLGLAYTETFHPSWALTQFDLARALDANDPTPWLFRADLLQQQNRLPEALRSLETAMDKNDNRALFRTRALLSSDAAAQSANQARIYQALKLEDRAQGVASLAVSKNPADFAGHHALALAYADEPEAEVLRADEALQTKLLQPISANALNVGIGQTGVQTFPWLSPSRMGLHEYRSLFNQRRISGYLSSVFGSQDTQGYEWQLQMQDQRSALTAGQYSLESDGFRDNNQLDVQLSEMAFHFQAIDSLKLFAEYSHRDERYGDLTHGINSPHFRATQSRHNQLQIKSFGAAYSVSPQQGLLLHSARATVDLNNTPSAQLGEVTTDGEHEKHELAYLQQSKLFSWQLGYAVEDYDSTTQFNLTLPFPPFNVAQKNLEEALWRHAYLNVVTTDDRPLRLTVGFGATDIERARDALKEDRRERNFRLGLQLEPYPDLSFTLARWRAFAERVPRFGRLEPTHLFDISTRANLSAFSVDDSEALRLTWSPGSFTLIAQVQDSEYQEPAAGANDNSRTVYFPIERHDATLDLSYLVNDRLSLYSRWMQRSQQNRYGDVSRAIPADLDLQTGGVGASFFMNRLFNFGVELMWTEQAEFYQRAAEEPLRLEEYDEQAPLVNANVELRLPRRLGHITVEGYNLLDEPFSGYTGQIQLASESTIPSAPEFAPGRSVLVKLTVNF